MKKQFIIFLLWILISEVAFAQKTQFSLATDVDLSRSFNKGQRYWTIGQTTHFHFHFSPKDAAFVWISYYADGKYSNILTAGAKSSTTVPQEITYQNKSRLGLNHISVGWKRYLRGTFDAEKSWNLYGYAGFGLMLGHITNTFSTSIDTSMYIVPVLNGEARFKRLTFDLGLGCEFPIGGDVFLYVEGKTMIPTTDYPSPYLLVNENAPFTAVVGAGLRILFH